MYELQLYDSENNSYSLIAAEVPKICQPLYRQRVPEHVLSFFDDVQFADDYDNDRSVNIDILIGMDA